MYLLYRPRVINCSEETAQIREGQIMSWVWWAPKAIKQMSCRVTSVEFTLPNPPPLGHRIYEWLGEDRKQGLLCKVILKAIFGAGYINSYFIHTKSSLHPFLNFVHLFCKYRLDSCYVPGTLLGSGDIIVRLTPYLGNTSYFNPAMWSSALTKAVKRFMILHSMLFSPKCFELSSSQ